MFSAKKTPDVLRNWTHMLCAEGECVSLSLCGCVCVCSLGGFSGLRFRGERVIHLLGEC